MTGDLFTQALPADPVAVATKHGATFERMTDRQNILMGTEWHAIARRRGRSADLVRCAAPTKEGAAMAFCLYFNHKV